MTLSGTSSQWSSSCRSVVRPRSNFRVSLTTRAAALTVTSRYSLERDGRIGHGFWHGGFLRPAYTLCCKEIQYLQNKGTSIWNFFLNSGFRKFRTAYRPSKRACYQLNSIEKGKRSERDKLARRRSAKLTIPPSSDARQQ